jgi:hypothetical protein
VPVGLGKKSAIRSFKLPIKEKFRKSHDILGYAELVLYSNRRQRQNGRTYDTSNREIGSVQNGLHIQE